MNEIELREILKYKKIFEIVDIAIAITTLNEDKNLSKIIEANEAAVKIFGYTKEELLTKSLSDFGTEETEEEKIESMNQKKDIIFEDKEINFEMISRDKNGNKLFLRIKSILVEDKTSPYLIHIIKDITEKKIVEKNLQESKEKFKIMFKNTPIATWYEDYSLVFEYFDELKSRNIKNLESFLNRYPKELIKFTKLVKVIDLNKAALDLYETKTKKELLSSFDVKFVASLFETFKKGIISIWNGNESGEYDSIIETFKGNKKNVIINYKRLPITEKEIHYLITLKDITEKKRIESAKIRNHSLNALGEMASSVAHDFNNSLQSILGNLELIIYDKEISNDNLKILKTIKKATIDAAERVKIVRRFNKKKENSSYKLIDIEIIINDVIIQSRPIWKDDAEKKGVFINIERNYSKVSPVLGDSAELRSVIYNILKNSIEAMPKGGDIIFSTFEINNFVQILISDTGIGMSDEVKNKVFQPFYTTKGFELGRGLGMSGVYNIIKEHAGKVSILENTDNGVIVEILLPISKYKKENFKKNMKENNKVLKNNKKLNILWVDDEEMIRDVGIKYINLMGYRGKTAKDGIEALNFLKEEEYDLVITDIGMPNMNGWQLINEIRKIYFDRIKVIVVTGWGSNIPDDLNRTPPFYTNLQKPIQLKELQKIIEGMTIKA